MHRFIQIETVSRSDEFPRKQEIKWYKRRNGPRIWNYCAQADEEGQLIFTPEMWLRQQMLNKKKKTGQQQQPSTTAPSNVSRDFRSHRCDYSDLCVAKSVFRWSVLRWISFNIVVAYRSIFLMNFVCTVANATAPRCKASLHTILFVVRFVEWFFFCLFALAVATWNQKCQMNVGDNIFVKLQCFALFVFFFHLIVWHTIGGVIVTVHALFYIHFVSVSSRFKFLNFNWPPILTVPSVVCGYDCSLLVCIFSTFVFVLFFRFRSILHGLFCLSACTSERMSPACQFQREAVNK